MAKLSFNPRSWVRSHTLPRRLAYIGIILGIISTAGIVVYYSGYQSVNGLTMWVDGICTKVAQNNSSISYGFNLELFAPVSNDTQIVKPAFTLTIFLPSSDSLNSYSANLGPLTFQSGTLHRDNAVIRYSMRFYLNDSRIANLLSGLSLYNSTLTMKSLVVSGLYQRELARSSELKLPQQWDFDVAHCPSNLA